MSRIDVKATTEWFELLKEHNNDVEVAGILLDSLDMLSHRFNPNNQLQVANLLLACRLHQMSKGEGKT